MMKADQPVASNCISCAIGPLLQITSWATLPCLSMQCGHPFKDTSVKLSNSRHWVALIQIFFMVILILNYVFTINDLVKENYDIFVLCDLLASVVYVIRATIVLANGIYCKKLIFFAFKGIAVILKYWEYLMSEMLLEYDTVVRVRAHCMKLVLMLMLAVTIGSKDLLYVKTNTTWLVMRQIGRTFSLFMECAVILVYHIAMLILTLIFRAYQKNLRRVLINSLPRKHNMIESKTKSLNNMTLVESLKNYRRLHIALVWNMRYMWAFTNPAILIWVMSTVFLIVICGFLDLVMAIDGPNTSSNYFDLFFMQLQLLTAGFGFVYLVFEINGLKQVSTKALSFLFTFPISKLSFEEAAQFELLITTMSINKPILRATDLFTVGTSMLASIAGTVVTYVLVALQFHTAVEEET